MLEDSDDVRGGKNKKKSPQTSEKVFALCDETSRGV